MWFICLVFFSQVFCESSGAFFGVGFLEGREISELWPVLNHTEAFSGEFFQTNVAENLSEFSVEFLIAKIGSPDLPRWLTFEPDTFNLVGIPLDKDVGAHNLFIVSIMSDNGSSIFLGAQTFDIYVRPTRLRALCPQNEEAISGELLLDANGTKLNGTERVELYQEFLSIYNVTGFTTSLLFQELSFGSENTSSQADEDNSSCKVLRDHATTLSNPGDPLLRVTWVMACGLNDSTTWEETTLDDVYHRTTILNGSLSGYPVTTLRVWRSVDHSVCPWYKRILRYSTTMIGAYLSTVHSTMTSSSTSSVFVLDLGSSSARTPLSTVHGDTSSIHHHTVLSKPTITSTHLPSGYFESTTISQVASFTVQGKSSNIYHHTSLVQSTTTTTGHTKGPSAPFDRYVTTTSLPTLSQDASFSATHGGSFNIYHHTSLMQANVTSNTVHTKVLSSVASDHHDTTAISTPSLSSFSIVHGDTSTSHHHTSLVQSTITNTWVLAVTSDYYGTTIPTLSQVYPTTSHHHTSLVQPTGTDVSSTSYATPLPGNTPPVLNRKLPLLNITTCEHVFMELPRDTFLDKEDGDTRNLSLQLLAGKMSTENSDWIHFDAQNQVIYGVPVATLLSKNSKHVLSLDYVLLAVDSSGATVNTTLELIIIDEPSDIGQQISIKVDVYLEPRPSVALQLVKLISGYVYKNDVKTMKVLNFTMVSGSPVKTEMTWSDCKAARDICDVSRVERTSQLIMVSPHVVNPQFMLALVPDFVVRDVSATKYGACLNEPPLAITDLLQVNVTCCEVFRYQVPTVLFSDSDDGYTRNLSLSFRLPNGARLNSDSWVYLDDISQTIEGIISFEQAQNLMNQKFLLVATDSGKLSANVSVHMTIQQPLPSSSSYHVSLILKRVTSLDVVKEQLQELFLIVNKLTSFFGDNSSKNVRLLSYRDQDAIQVFTWTNSSIDSARLCDHSAIANISRKLRSLNGEVKVAFKEAMLPELEVQFVFEEKVGNCKEGANEAPRTLRQLLTISLNQSLGYFQYFIPGDTFHDDEDGSTRNLELTLLSATFETISKSSWIVLNSQEQMLYGLPNMAILDRQPFPGYKFVLLAKDSGGKVTTSDVIIKLARIPQVDAPKYQITAQLRSYHDRSLPSIDHVVRFLRNVASLNGGSENMIDVISYNVSTKYPADVSITWTNHSTSFGSCDHESILGEFALLWSDQQGEASEAFANILLPFFIVQKLQLDFLGSCAMSENHPPVLVNPLPTITARSFELLEFKIPEKMFFDQEDGFSRNLTIFVLDEHNQILDSDFWIFFSSSTQTLYGVPTRTVATQQPRDGYVLQVVAMDTGGKSGNTTILVEIQELESVSFNFEIKLEATAAQNYTSSTNTVLDFYWKLESYLTSVQNLLFIDYTAKNSTFIFSVSTRQLTGNNRCEFSEIDTLRQLLFWEKLKDDSSSLVSETRPNQNLSQKMRPEFVVMKITASKQGPCSNTPPTLLQPLPSFLVTSHGLFSLSVPPNTFYDAQDGFSNNLTLTLLTSFGQTLPPDSWLQFNQILLEFEGIITDKIILGKPEANYSFMLQASDAYGLKVNTTFNVFVPDALNDIGFKFNMIFRSNFSSVVPHVEILGNLLSKIAAYFQDNNTEFLNVNSFERGTGVPSTDILIWSNITFDSMDCDLRTISEMSHTVRQTDNQPTSDFREALLPDFQIVLVFEQRQGSCEGTHNSPPQTLEPVLVLNISILPSTLSYKIPENVFYDLEDGDTRNLSLLLYDVNMDTIPGNSSVQLNSPLQQIYAIFTEKDLSSQNVRFILMATDSGGKTASAFVEISLRNITVSFNYKLKVQFHSYLSSSLSDVAQLLHFQEELRSFSQLRDTHVVDYTRSHGYPARFVAYFINASASRDMSCDHDKITRILDVFTNGDDGSLKQDFLTRFLPAFVVDEISIQRFGSCDVVWNEPPKLTKNIPRLNISVCETWRYKVPWNAFMDIEDGSTRNLTLDFQETEENINKNISWIFLDIQSQTIHAVPSVELIIQQPSDGYSFTLSATDSHGSSTSTIIRIFLFDDILVDSYRLTVAAKIPDIFRNSGSHVTQNLMLFVEAIQRYLVSGSSSMRVVTSSVTSSHVMITWSNCSFCYSPCDYEGIARIRQATIFARSLPQPMFIQALAPAFILESVVEEMRGPCLNEGPLVNRSIGLLAAQLCKRLHYKVPDDIFYDSEDGGTGNLSLSLLDSELNPLSEDYWLAFDKESQTMIGYPNMEARSSQPESGYEFILTAVDRHGLSARTTIRVIYDTAPLPPSSYEVTLVLRAQFRELPNNVGQQTIILAKLAKYMNSDEKSIRIHSFVRGGSNSTTSFLTWSNCTFPVNSCDVLKISETSRRLKKDGAILEQFRGIFPPEFELQFVFEQRSDLCLKDSNFQPKVVHSLEPIILRSSCGVWTYPVPEGLFFDEEEGYTRNLTLSIRKDDFSEIPLNSWVQFDKASQTLYGFPGIHRRTNSSSDTFFLVAMDSKGKFATTTLKIVFGINDSDVTYHITSDVTSYLGSQFPDIYHIRKFMGKLALYLNLTTDSLVVVKYEKTTPSAGMRFLISWTNCSRTTNSCNHEEIQAFRGKLLNHKTTIKPNFLQSLLPYFVPNFFAIEEFGPCLDQGGNSYLRLVKPIKSIFIYSGNLLWFEITITADKGIAGVSLMLEFSNKTVIPADYWLQFNNITNIVSGVLLVENSWNHSFRLVARDHYGNEAYDVFPVVVEPQCVQDELLYQVYMEVEHTENDGRMLLDFLIKLETFFKPWFPDGNFTIVNLQDIREDYFAITWSHNEAFCGKFAKNSQFFRELSDKFLANGTILPAFRSALLPEFGIVNVTELAAWGTAPVVRTEYGGQEDRWLMYLIPIVTLLTFLLFCFLFFVLRSSVFVYRRREDTIVLEEHVTSSPRDIHVVRSREVPLTGRTRGRMTVVNEEFVANAFENEAPEILLDRRVSPSIETIRGVDDVGPRVVPTPPLYVEAVSNLGSSSSPTARLEPNSTRIEMTELPMRKRREVGLEGNPWEISEVDGFLKHSQPRRTSPYLRRSPNRPSSPTTLGFSPQSGEPYGDENDDVWSSFNKDNEEFPTTLRLPASPNVGMLRLPPVPKPLSTSPASSLANTPDHENQSATSFHHNALLTSTPAISLSTVNISQYQQPAINTPSHVAINFPEPQSRIPSEIETGSPYCGGVSPSNAPWSETFRGVSPSNALEPESPYRTPQSPIGFPVLAERVPYVNARTNGYPASSGGPIGTDPMRSQDDLHQVLGDLRNTVNRELDRREEVEQYLDYYMNKR